MNIGSFGEWSAPIVEQHLSSSWSSWSSERSHRVGVGVGQAVLSKGS